MKSKSELDRYLEDNLVPLTTKNFNVLYWWKVAGTRYPTLRRIARDIFAIHVTTVLLKLLSALVVEFLAHIAADSLLI